MFETEMSPGGPQPLIHQAGAPTCLPHSLLALMKNGLFVSMPLQVAKGRLGQANVPE